MEPSEGLCAQFIHTPPNKSNVWNIIYRGYFIETDNLIPIILTLHIEQQSQNKTVVY